MSHSAQVSQSRPFYADHGQAYDLLVTDPVEPWVEAVRELLVQAGSPTAAVLDAGCGTGRHAAALSALGHRVDLADAAGDLLRQAAERCPSARALRVDLCALDVGPVYQAVMCRGVLNDIVEDADRDAVLRSFAASLRPEGLLILDVREEDGARRRADGTPRRHTVEVRPGTRLDFTSTATWDAGLLHVHEQYVLHVAQDAAQESTSQESTFDFVMRPWSEEELDLRLSAAGFHDVRTAPGVGRKTTDRLFVTAVR
jgi:SAM-dependent methyltransferase